MLLESISDHITFYWSNDPTFELHKSYIFGTVSRSKKKAKDRKKFCEDKGLEENSNRFFKENLAFGDRSIAEQFNLNVEFNNVPITFSTDFLAFSFMSPIESSTRYLRMDSYYEFLNFSYNHGYDLFRRNCDHALKTYQKAYDPLNKFYKEKFPMESIDWKGIDESAIKGTWERAINSKTFDAIKVFLPAATLTNMTICMNARAMQDCVVDASYEDHHVGLHSPFLEPLRQYLSNDWKTASLFKHMKQAIADYNTRGENGIPILNKNAYVNVSGNVKVWEQTKDSFTRPSYNGVRTNRHIRLPKAYQHNMFLIDIESSLGAFRDLQRHRQVTKTISGFLLPFRLEIIKDLGINFSSIVKEFNEGLDLYGLQNNPLQVACAPLGLKMKWSMFGSLYEISNIVELRTQHGGYWEYIQIARDIAKAIGNNSYFQHADMETNYNETLPLLKQEMKKNA